MLRWLGDVDHTAPEMIYERAVHQLHSEEVKVRNALVDKHAAGPVRAECERQRRMRPPDALKGARQSHSASKNQQQQQHKRLN